MKRVCPVCGRHVIVNPNGTLRMHPGRGRFCDGSARKVA